MRFCGEKFCPRCGEGGVTFPPLCGGGVMQMSLSVIGGGVTVVPWGEGGLTFLRLRGEGGEALGDTDGLPLRGREIFVCLWGEGGEIFACLQGDGGVTFACLCGEGGVTFACL